MPHSLNGIGTSYSHERNSLVAEGQCRHCGHVGRLVSRDATLVVTLFWIPVWRVREYRLVELCARCGRHGRIPLAEFRAHLEGALAEEKARARAGDLEAHERVAVAYMGVGYWGDAVQWLETLVEATPGDAAAHALLGAALESFRPRTAFWSYEKAHALAPEDVNVLRSLVRSLLYSSEHEKAAVALAKLAEREPENAEHILERARALRRAQLFDDAVREFERYFERRPERRSAYLLVDEMTAAKRFSSVPLTSFEVARESSRRRTNRLGLLLILGVALLALVGAIVESRRVRIVVDNPTALPLSLRLDGAPWLNVAPGKFADVWVWRGKHKVELEAAGEKDAFLADWNPGNVLFGATCICDPLQAGSYIVYEVGYGHEASTPAEYHVCERSFATRSLDHVFTTPPRSIRMKRGQTETRRVLIRDHSMRPIDAARVLLDRKEGPAAVKFLERHLARSDDHELLFALHAAHGLADDGEGDGFQKWLEARLVWKKEATNFHRFRQDRLRAAGDQQTLDREYRKAPGDGFGMYLYGRASSSSKEAMEYYRMAALADPELPWPCLDLGEELLDRGEDAEALEQLLRFDALRRRVSPRPTDELWRGLFVTRRWAGLDKLIAQAGDEPYADMVRAHRLIATDAAPGPWSSFHKDLRDRRGTFGWIHELLIDRARWNGEDREADRQVTLLSSAAGWHEEPELLRAGTLLASGDRPGAEASLKRVFSSPRITRRAVLLAILTAIVDEWAGRDGSAWLGVATEVASVKSDHDIIRFLGGGLTAGELAASDRHRSTDARAVSRIARALREKDEHQRQLLLDEALRFGAWGMSDAAFLVRHVFSRSAPKR